MWHRKSKGVRMEEQFRWEQEFFAQRQVEERRSREIGERRRNSRAGRKGMRKAEEYVRKCPLYKDPMQKRTWKEVKEERGEEYYKWTKVASDLRDEHLRQSELGYVIFREISARPKKRRVDGLEKKKDERKDAVACEERVGDEEIRQRAKRSARIQAKKARRTAGEKRILQKRNRSQRKARRGGASRFIERALLPGKRKQRKEQEAVPISCKRKEPAEQEHSRRKVRDREAEPGSREKNE
ncbi:hypothetical protein CAEBREN_29739 [Caenorhabditis brenneri]|uniref:Uncharacterized protein n=1 Tax=Caenorhabditis brenneri TaxID=135651 RepID=G0NX41_CAEBE|nr:hypothetical protein CAEBREN_29739 [Caenorhabditis brenneri]